MAKKPKVEVDESLVKQVIAGQLPITTKVTRVIPEQIPSGTATDAIPAEPPSVPEIDTEKIPDETPSVSAAQEPRRRRTPPLSDYERMFLTPVEYGIRATLYVNASTKRKILEILKRIGGERLSATSYVDNILQHHIETFRDDINRLDRKRNFENLFNNDLKISNYALQLFIRVRCPRHFITRSWHRHYRFVNLRAAAPREATRS